MSEPTDDTVALAAFLLGGWRYADEIAGSLKRLGFDRPSSQWIARHLTEMCLEDAPRFERDCSLPARYRVTHWAERGLGNEWNGFEGRRNDREER